MKLAAPRPGMGGHGDPPPERSVGHWRCYGFPQATATIGGRMAACQPRALPVGNRASAVHKATSACPCGGRATAERPNHHRRPRIPKRSIYIANSRGCQIKVPLPGAAVHEFVQPSGHVGSTASWRGTWSVIRSRDQHADLPVPSRSTQLLEQLSVVVEVVARPRAANTCQSGDVTCCHDGEPLRVGGILCDDFTKRVACARLDRWSKDFENALARLAPTCWQCIHAPNVEQSAAFSPRRRGCRLTCLTK
jgi:hypothetical protein